MSKIDLNLNMSSEESHYSHSNILCCQPSLSQLMIIDASSLLKPRSLKSHLDSLFFSHFTSNIGKSFCLCLQSLLTVLPVAFLSSVMNSQHISHSNLNKTNYITSQLWSKHSNSVSSIGDCMCFWSQYGC